MVSPLPPAPTGVAEYTIRLFDALRRLSAAQKLSFTFEAPGYYAPHDLGAFGARVYQIGNNSLHAKAYRAAIEAPGIVVLHDAVLHHLLLGTLTEAEYIDEFIFNYDAWYRDLAAELWRHRGHAMNDDRYFRYPLLRRLTEASTAVVVHNPKAARLAREALLRSARKVEVVEIPHFVESTAPPSAAEVANKREELGIPPDTVVISCFGYLRPPKRLHSLFAAVRRLNVDYRLLIVGQFVSSQYEQSLENHLRDPRVLRLPYVPDAEFRTLAAMTDICVNLRDPSVGETSGIAMKLMAAGKPVIVTDGEEYARFPETAVLRVDAGASEVEMLAHYLYALATDPEMRAQIGSQAAAYVREHHNLDRAAGAFLELLKRSA